MGCMSVGAEAVNGEAEMRQKMVVGTQWLRLDAKRLQVQWLSSTMPSQIHPSMVPELLYIWNGMCSTILSHQACTGLQGELDPAFFPGRSPRTEMDQVDKEILTT
ncbi:hypothetical protein BVC80_1831g216 [Macleaya cordata]|uniref:Uncharacterized protein n=1 Tax=Macleaya cordata TaxID=56857 RepID=A0A200R7I7_MACCD|nr:hypothetical protein BVC80_1831g216 [Macleaya cordata]